MNQLDFTSAIAIAVAIGIIVTSALVILGSILLSAIYCALGGALTFGAWNIFAVTLLHCAPLSYWQALVVFCSARAAFLLAAIVRKK